MPQSNKELDDEFKKKRIKRVPVKDRLQERCPVCRVWMLYAPGIGYFCDNDACPVVDDSDLYRLGQKKGEVGDGKPSRVQLMAEVEAFRKHSSLCSHRRFAIVCLGKGGPFQLFCGDCKKPMPFVFYNKKEWDKA